MGTGGAKGKWACMELVGICVIFVISFAGCRAARLSVGFFVLCFVAKSPFPFMNYDLPRTGSQVGFQYSVG